MTIRPIITLVAVGTTLLLVSCGPPTRDGAVQSTAKKMCKRYDQCGELDNNYSSLSECRSEWEDNFYDSWGENACDNDQIDPQQLDECHVQIETFDCDSGGVGFLGLLIGSCSSGQVCSN